MATHLASEQTPLLFHDALIASKAVSSPQVIDLVASLLPLSLKAQTSHLTDLSLEMLPLNKLVSVLAVYLDGRSAQKRAATETLQELRKRFTLEKVEEAVRESEEVVERGKARVVEALKALEEQKGGNAGRKGGELRAFMARQLEERRKERLAGTKITAEVKLKKEKPLPEEEEKKEE